MEDFIITKNFKIFLSKEFFWLEKAKELRRKIFFKKEGKEEDAFDNICEHLIVLDTKNDLVIGTYRLLLGSVAKKNFGFYSELEFNLKNIIKNCQGEILEVSRFCLNSNYKKYILVSFMWKMLLKYIEKHKIRYIFGCVSIEDYDPLKIGKFLYFFQENYFSSSKFRVYPNFLNRYDYVKSLVRINKEKIYKMLPSLLRIYLKTGAVVCGEPAFDNYFDVVDFFMLLDTKKMNIEFVRRLIGNNNLFKKL